MLDDEDGLFEQMTVDIIVHLDSGGQTASWLRRGIVGVALCAPGGRIARTMTVPQKWHAGAASIGSSMPESQWHAGTQQNLTQQRDHNFIYQFSNQLT